MSPTSYVPVEGVCGADLKGWQWVCLCKDCSRVVGHMQNLRTAHWQQSDEHDDWTWNWGPGGETPELCPWCGGTLRVDRKKNENHVYWVYRFYRAKARWHSEALWYWPPSWKRGHWEVQSFEKYMKPEERKNEA